MGVGVGVAVGVADGEGVGSVGLNTGLISGFASALTAIPLLQINFLPDLMQVYLIPPDVEVAPALLQVAPALGAAALTGVARVISKTPPIASAPHLRMAKD